MKHQAYDTKQRLDDARANRIIFIANSRFDYGQNLGRKRTHLHFADDSLKGESENELNSFNLTVEIYVGTAASRETYLEIQTNGSCGD